MSRQLGHFSSLQGKAVWKWETRESKRRSPRQLWWENVYPLQLCIFNMIAVSPVGFILLTNLLIVGLIPRCQQLENLRNWVSALGFSITYWCQLRDLWALAAFSAAWGLCFPQGVLEAVAKLLCASMGTTGGTEWWKGGFGAEWGSLAHVQPLRNSHCLFQRMAMRGIKWNQDRNSVWPQAPGKSCSFFSCPGRCNGQSLWVPCTIQCLGTSTPPTKTFFSHRLLNRDELLQGFA